nr:unnamed protein product [Haemonchus contortus]
MLSRPSDILKLAVSSLLLFSFVCVNSAEESLAPEELAADIPLPAYAAPSAEANVDRIKSVEIEPTQIVIITTKQGPVDSLKIHIELVDLKDNRTLPPVELFGLFLVVARGQAAEMAGRTDREWTPAKRNQTKFFRSEDGELPIVTAKKESPEEY